ncbi:MAG: hypothetical protein LBT78_11575 [Tannerella sp.]|jgi:hypothetical protein|nr:hypothetical protein [Tannerella sp.]
MKSIYLIPIAFLLLTACEKLEDANTKDLQTPEAVIEMNDEEFVVVPGESETSLNRFSITKPVNYYNLEGLSSDITKYNKSHVKSITCKSASLAITTDNSVGTVIRNLVMSTDSPNASTFQMSEYTLGESVRTAETRQYAEKLGMDIVLRDQVLITATGETDAPAGTHFNVNLILEDVNVQVSIAN